MKPKHLNKVRDMAGVRPGYGSAGRANGDNVEKRLTAGPPVMTGYADVGRACDRWLRENDSRYRETREYFARQNAERKERRQQSEAGGVR